MSNTRKCLYCAESIQREARKCRYCGEWLPACTPGSSSSARDDIRATQDRHDKGEISDMGATPEVDNSSYAEHVREQRLDSLYDEVRDFVVRHRAMSASVIQRRFEVGYPRAGRLVDQLEKEGVLSPADGTKTRKVLRFQPRLSYAKTDSGFAAGEDAFRQALRELQDNSARLYLLAGDDEPFMIFEPAPDPSEHYHIRYEGKPPKTMRDVPWDTAMVVFRAFIDDSADRLNWQANATPTQTPAPPRPASVSTGSQPQKSARVQAPVQQSSRQPALAARPSSPVSVKPDSVGITTTRLSDFGLVLGLIGAACLAFGAFAPVVGVMGFSKTYFGYWGQDGSYFAHVAIGLAGLAVAWSLQRDADGLCGGGIMALGVVGWTLYKTRSIISAATDAGTATDPASRIASEFVQQAARLEWGWAVLLIGAAFLIAASASREAH